MNDRALNAGDLICTVLTRLGIKTVFGLPGTQNVQLFEALRNSSLRTVLATSELAAGFMAAGHFRATGHIAVLATISGPGFTWALPGLAEARLHRGGYEGRRASRGGRSRQVKR